jgi:hypothetical protein
VLENHLLEIKECIKEMVDKSGLMTSVCQLDVLKFPVKYLTCVEFERDDFPWLSKDVPVGGKRGRKMMGGNEIAKQKLEAARRAQEEEDEGLEMSEDEFKEAEGGGVALSRKRMRYD